MLQNSELWQPLEHISGHITLYVPVTDGLQHQLTDKYFHTENIVNNLNLTILLPSLRMIRIWTLKRLFQNFSAIWEKKDIFVHH